ncbi:MAG: hypothetical protein PHI59_00495 [Candidatus Omnitrophica bacterium]|nr:hypothetical protein [Candidatus Omnitrophota bacterium]
MKKPPLLHPFLFALFPVLFLFAHNLGQVRPGDILLPSAFLLIVTLLLILLLASVLKDYKKAGLIVSLALILCFSYGPIYDTGLWWQINGFFIMRHRYLTAIWGALFILGIYGIIKRRGNLDNVTRIFNVVAGSLVAISLINIVFYEVTASLGKWAVKNHTPGNLNICITKSEAASVCPDIYYIILDRYNRADILKEVYGFDNSEFINYLTSKGFYVASRSNANYGDTEQSLCSSLNMEFIRDMSNNVLAKLNDRRLIYDKLQNHRVLRFLKSHGYRYVHLGSFFQPTSHNHYADINFNWYLLSEFPLALYKTSIFCSILEKLELYDVRREQWERTLYEFDKLSNMPGDSRPTFVFAHLVIPHDPYVFDSNGDFLTKEEADKRSHKENYLNQIIFANREVRKLVDKLLSSEKPPIIIIQSDEGQYPLKYLADFYKWPWKNAPRGELREKMGILNAYYLPGADKSILYPSITPVNSFRVVFNLYFGEEFELLPDRSYAFSDNLHLYDFVDVSDKIK